MHAELTEVEAKRKRSKLYGPAGKASTKTREDSPRFPNSFISLPFLFSRLLVLSLFLSPSHNRHTYIHVYTRLC